MNRNIPSRNSRRWPNRSAARPPSSRKPANTIVYALTIHCSPLLVKRRSVRIAGRATLTTDTSRITMNCPRQTTARIAQSGTDRIGGAAVVAGWGSGALLTVPVNSRP